MNFGTSPLDVWHGSEGTGLPSRGPFRRVYDELWSGLLTQAAEVEINLVTAVHAWLDLRVDLAREVRRRGRAIHLREIELDRECLKILTLHQPVASDFRRVVTVLKVNVHLERISELARHIAKRVRKLSRPTRLAGNLVEEMETLAQESLKQARSSLDALASLDVDQARAVSLSDRFLNARAKEMVRQVKDYARRDPERIDDWFRLANTARNFERIGDHAAMIAEWVIYLKEGALIRRART